MTQEEILYNKRCAKFLGWHNAGMKDLELWKSSENSIGVQTSELKFHSDWNCIMEVYIKINKLIQEKSTTNFVFATETENLHLNLWNAFEDENCSQELVVQAIDQFLIWYNE